MKTHNTISMTGKDRNLETNQMRMGFSATGMLVSGITSEITVNK